MRFLRRGAIGCKASENWLSCPIGIVKARYGVLLICVVLGPAGEPASIRPVTVHLLKSAVAAPYAAYCFAMLPWGIAAMAVGWALAV